MFNGRIVKRSWGWYWTILDRTRFKVKLLRFSGKQPMSTQYHNLRSELWLFLNGRLAGEHKVIPPNNIHTFKAEEPTYVIEIQYGDACIEEDIVRV